MTPALTATYDTFCERIRSGPLYRRMYGYYTLYLILVLLGIAVGFYLLTTNQNIVFQTLNGVFLAFVFVQGGMLGHDLAHQQVFAKKSNNDFFSSLAWGLIGGLSSSKWFEKHNAHHQYTNQVGKDPDLNIPFIFSEAQLEGGAKPVGRILRPYQHIIFFLLLPFVYFGMLTQAFRYIFLRFSFRTFFELCLIALHFAAVLGMLFFNQPLGNILAFLAAHFAFIGVYMSLVFAPNHKGRAIIPANVDGTWVEQITSTRNVYHSSLIFHIFGGLNFQIEHHIFSDMARPNYRKVGPLVKEFCKTHNITYHETTWIGSLVEIYQALKREAQRA